MTPITFDILVEGGLEAKGHLATCIRDQFGTWTVFIAAGYGEPNQVIRMVPDTVEEAQRIVGAAIDYTKPGTPWPADGIERCMAYMAAL